MKKFSILGLLALWMVLPLMAADLTYVKGLGKLIVKSSGGTLGDVIVTSFGEGSTITTGVGGVFSIYDCTTPSAATAATLRFKIPMAVLNSLSVTGTTGLLGYRIPVNAMFRNGIVVDSGASTTMTATYNLGAQL